MAVTVKDWAEAFLVRRSPATRRNYKSDLEQFAVFVNELTIAQALAHVLNAGGPETYLLALRWQQQMREAGLSPATRNRRLATLRSALKMGRQLGLLTWTIDVDREPAESYRDTRGPGEQAYRKMLDIAGPREGAILRLLHDLGLRVGEVSELDVGHLDFARIPAEVSIMGKGRSERETLTLPGPTAEALRTWLQDRGQAPGPLFTSRAIRYQYEPLHRLSRKSLWRLVRDCGRAAGVGHVHPHGLRHTAITTALELTGGDVAKVATFSRHKSLDVLRRYDDNRLNGAGEVADLVAGKAIAE